MSEGNPNFGLFILGVLIWPNSVRQHAVGCLTEDLLYEFTQGAAMKNKRLMRQALNGCIFMRDNTGASAFDQTLTG